MNKHGTNAGNVIGILQAKRCGDYDVFRCIKKNIRLTLSRLLFYGGVYHAIYT